jgi:perosamine synthetase
MASNLEVDLIISSIRNVIDQQGEKVPLHAPVFAGNEWVYVKDCLDTGWVSSVGQYVDRFERMLEEFTGVPHAVAVVNGTAALHIALKLGGVEAGDEVLVPDLTFVATANAVSYIGAIPHFADVELRTLGLDPYKLDDYLREVAEVKDGACWNRQTGRRIKAVVPMHTFGHPVDLDPLVEVCSRFRLELIEDAAESLGSYYKGKHTGSYGKLSAISFNGNKIITTGGGGAILTHDAELARRAKHLTTTAKLPHAWEYVHDEIGYNYRLPNINAALGCAQMEHLPGFIEQKRLLAESYRAEFAGKPGVTFFVEPEYARSNYWLNAIMLDEEHQDLRDNVLDELNKVGLMSRPAWTLMHKLETFKDCPSMDVTASERIARRLINIPSSAGLAKKRHGS